MNIWQLQVLASTKGISGKKVKANGYSISLDAQGTVFIRGNMPQVQEEFQNLLPDKLMPGGVELTDAESYGIALDVLARHFK